MTKFKIHFTDSEGNKHVADMQAESAQKARDAFNHSCCGEGVFIDKIKVAHNSSSQTGARS